MRTEFQRFVAKIKPPSDPVRDCWLWTGAKTRDGYGRFKVSSKVLRAHRYSYALTLGAIPRGMQLDHLCRNRACVNPYHLEQVTGRENVSRGLVGKLRPGKASRFVGVLWRRDCRRWRAVARIGGKKTYLGHFDSEEDAARAYRDFIRRADSRGSRI